MAWSAPFQLYRCHGYASNGAPHRWVFVQAEDRDGNPVTEGGNDVYELYNLAAGRCLAVTATRVAQPLILTSCITTSTSIALWELRPTTPASHDFQLALSAFTSPPSAGPVAGPPGIAYRNPGDQILT